MVSLTQMACKTINSILDSDLNDSKDFDGAHLAVNGILHAAIIIGILRCRPKEGAGGNE